MSRMSDCSRAIRIVKLGEDRLDELLSIQTAVCEQLAMPELYFPVSQNEMHEFLQPGGLCFGAMHESRLVGFFGVLLMPDRPDNVGYDLGLGTEELTRVVYYKAVNVLPKYRGLGLQKVLTCAAFRELGVDLPSAPGDHNDPDLRVLCATVSPHNLSSLKSFLECGFWIAGLKPKYKGYQRYLVMRRTKIGIVDPTDCVTVPIQNYPEQLRLLAQGMLGIRLHVTQDDGPAISYIGSKK